MDIARSDPYVFMYTFLRVWCLVVGQSEFKNWLCVYLSHPYYDCPFCLDLFFSPEDGSWNGGRRLSWLGF